jgi:hypothetical protein
MTVAFAYPHIEKPPGEPARRKRIPCVRVAQIVMDYLPHAGLPTRCAVSMHTCGSLVLTIFSMESVKKPP